MNKPAGVQQHHVATRAAGAGQHSRNNPRVYGRIAPLKIGRRGFRHAEIRRMHIERRHGSIPALGDFRVPGRRHLIDAVGAMHHPRTLGSKQHQGPRHQIGQLRLRHADKLAGGRRRDWSGARAD